MASAPANNPADGQITAALPPGGNAKDFSSQRSEPAASDVARLAPQPGTPPASLTTPKAVVKAATPAAAQESATKTNATAAKVNAPVSADRITQLANAGNPTALTLLGLKALDSG